MSNGEVGCSEIADKERAANWSILLGFFVLLIAATVIAERRNWSSPSIGSFFNARDAKGNEVSYLLLGSSTTVSWVFAKSIANAATLGSALGMPGIVYSFYWIAFIPAAVILTTLRYYGGYFSMHHYLRSRFGHGGAGLFSIIIILRLWNEVWSNSLVIAKFFGTATDYCQDEYYLTSWLAVFLPLSYTLISGMRSSFVTDLTQLALLLVVLTIVIGIIWPKMSGQKVVNEGNWTTTGGLDLGWVAIMQAFSYPLHDKVLWDRAFVANVKKTFWSFILAGIGGAIIIIVGSTIGMFHRLEGLSGDAIVGTARSDSVPLSAAILLNAVMITSAGSTLDSTFSSVGKLLAHDIFAATDELKVMRARVVMLLLAVAGAAMAHADPEVLSATTISGTMALGLAPPFVLHFWKRPGRVSYYTSVLIGLAFGGLYAGYDNDDNDEFPLSVGDGIYSRLLAINLIAFPATFVAYIVLALPFPALQEPVAVGDSEMRATRQHANADGPAEKEKLPVGEQGEKALSVQEP